jgi:hypothetical protein
MQARARICNHFVRRYDYFSALSPFGPDRISKSASVFAERLLLCLVLAKPELVLVLFAGLAL